MYQFDAHNIIRCLAEGIDPGTMNPLPPDSPLQKPDLIRAFYAATEALEKVKERDRRKQFLPNNTGKSWSPEEEERLATAFDSGTSAKVLAVDHERSISAIRARLVKLGKISEFDELN